MSFELRYTREANENLIRLSKNDPKAFQKALTLLAELQEHPRTGTGHPEQLSGDMAGCLLTDKTFRLPTEAEWEYAARGGNKSKGYIYSGSNTIGDVAWYDDTSSSTTHDVATKSPNELGIYDMSGNVWEWCQDWYELNYYSSSPVNNPMGPTSGSDRVYRGGSWNYIATYCRVAKRSKETSTKTGNYLGFRLAQ